MKEEIKTKATEYALREAKSLGAVGRIRKAFMDGYKEGYSKHRRENDERNKNDMA